MTHGGRRSNQGPKRAGASKARQSSVRASDRSGADGSDSDQPSNGVERRLDAGAREGVLDSARGGAVNLVGAVANAVFQFVLIFVMTRGLGARQTGVLFEAIALFTILSASAQLGADSGVVRVIPPLIVRRRHHEIGAVVRSALVPVGAAAMILGSVVFVAASPIASLFMHDSAPDEAIGLIRVLAPFLPLATLTLVLLAVTRAYGPMLPTVLIETIGKPATRLLLVGAVVAFGVGAMGTAVAWALPIALGFVAAVAVARRVVAYGPGSGVTRGAPTARSPVRFWRFSLPRGIAGILETTLGWLDILLIGAFRSAQEVGIYAAVNRTTIMALFATRAASMAIGPRLSALLSLDRRSDAQSLYQVMTWWLIAFTWPIYITLAIFSSVLLRIFGPAFADGAQALTVVSVAMLVNIATGNVNLVLLMAGKSSWNLANAAVSLALNVGLNLILIPKYGIEGAAIAWAASIVLWNVAAVVEVKLLLGLEPFGGGYVLASAAALVCFGATGLTALKLFGATPTGLLVHLVVSGASYAAVLYRARDVLHVEVLREAVALRRRSRSS